MTETTTFKAAPEHLRENKLAKQIFLSFRENKPENWITLFPTQAEFKELLDQMLAAQTEGLTQQRIDDMLMHRKEEADSLYLADFEHLMDQAARLEIHWENAVFVRFECMAAYPKKMTIKYLTGDIRFTCEGKFYLMVDVEALEIGNTYKLQAVKSIKEANKNWELPVADY